MFFSTAIIVAAFIPLFTMQGVEGQIFGPMARTYAYALIGALIATFTVTPCLASLLLPEQVEEVETFVVRWLRAAYTPVLRWSLYNRRVTVAIGLGLPGRFRLARQRGSAASSCRRSRRAICGSGPRCRRPFRFRPAMPIVNRIREILLRHPEVITVMSQHGRPDDGSDAAGFFNAEFFVPLKPFDQWPPGLTKEN